MDQFSFHGPFAYRWIDDVPVERIDLRSGERRPIEVGHGGIPPFARHDGTVTSPSAPGEPSGEASPCDALQSETGVRAAMAAWN
jgi:hypothetical protein